VTSTRRSRNGLSDPCAGVEDDGDIDGTIPVTGHDVRVPSIRVAYTLEQLWHRVPGGTAMAALRVAEALGGRDDVTLHGVAGRHRALPPSPWTPPIAVETLPLTSPLLYDAWLRLGWPRVESVVPDADVVHATTAIPCPTRRPLVVTIHDLAWRHDPSQFTRRGVHVFTRSLALTRRHAALVLCSSEATRADCSAAGLDDERLRVVPLGVEPIEVTSDDVQRVRALHGLPAEYLLFVGTVEPRKNLGRLVAALAQVRDAPPLVVAGVAGWGDAPSSGETVRFLGFVDERDKAALYAGAAALCYPSEREGFGMPVLEAMAQGAPVLTSRGTATEEAAGGAAVLVDPFVVDDIARGVVEVLERRDELADAGRRRAAEMTWHRTAEATLAAYRELA
jgi:glycosyltransferase involved in cell wall biosynthesis